jgi:hypothetical protein
MISDVLSDALHEIRTYLDEPIYFTCYREADGAHSYTHAFTLRVAHEKMQLVCKILDTPPTTQVSASCPSCGK